VVVTYAVAAETQAEDDPKTGEADELLAASAVEDEAQDVCLPRVYEELSMERSADELDWHT